jgi:SAM-dependent methyltransferase
MPPSSMRNEKPRFTVLVASGTLGFPPPTESRATTFDVLPNIAELLSPVASAVGVNVPTKHWPLAPLGRAFWLPASVRCAATILSTSWLCAKAGAAKVTAVDISASACAAARKNAEFNQLDIEVIEANVFDFLKSAQPEYDLIILDPPSFTKNKKTLMDAMRGYKEIHLRSLKLLEKGGLLSTFCCSHHASRELFLENLADASVDAKQALRLLAEHHQRADHPVLITLPETSYLKGFTCQVIATR